MHETISFFLTEAAALPISILYYGAFSFITIQFKKFTIADNKQPSKDSREVLC
jgi:hypothetical protein